MSASKVPGNHEERDDEGAAIPITDKWGPVLYEEGYDPASDPEVAVPVIRAIATLEGQSETEFRESPLHDSVNIEAVEALLFGPNQQGTNDAVPTVTFQYQEYLVRIHGDGMIQLFAADDHT